MRRARETAAEHSLDRVREGLLDAYRTVVETGEPLAAGQVVLAAGTGTPHILAEIGEGAPVEARKRTVFVIDAPQATDLYAPLVIDHRGIYFRPEGRHWICAIVPKEDGPAAPDDFEPDLHLFEEAIWPALYARSSAFAAVKVLRAWAGHYDFNRLDQNAIVGRWPDLPNLFVATGFSGHGLQQAPAVGRGLAELILTGGYRTLDLNDLGPERLWTGQPLAEAAII